MTLLNTYQSRLSETHSATGNPGPLPAAEVHNGVTWDDTISVKPGSMLNTFLQYNNLANNIQPIDSVLNSRERKPHSAISYETKRVLKRVMQTNPTPESSSGRQSENPVAIGFNTPAANVEDTTQRSSLGEAQPQQALALPKRHVMLRLREVIERTGLSRSTIYNKLDPGSKYYDPSFPKQVKIGSYSVRWIELGIDTWIEDQICASLQNGRMA